MFCQRTKEFLHNHGVGLAERNVASDESALAELKTLGVMATPLSVVNGEKVTGHGEVRYSGICGETRLEKVFPFWSSQKLLTLLRLL